jgi:hypothetical protein
LGFRIQKSLAMIGLDSSGESSKHQPTGTSPIRRSRRVNTCQSCRQRRVRCDQGIYNITFAILVLILN